MPQSREEAPGRLDYAEVSEALARFLRDRGTLAPSALSRAERAMRESGERLDLVLTRLGLIGEPEMARLSAEFLGREVVTMTGAPLQVDGLDPGYLRQARVVPIREDGDTLVVATANPFRPDTEAALAFLLSRPVRMAVASDREIGLALDRLSDPTVIDPAATSAGQAEQAREDDVRRLAELASEAPVVRLVHETIVRAVELGASDIHFEPGEAGLAIRLRIDGLLEGTEVLPERLGPPVISRIKIMGKLDIAERRMPQDGRIKVNVRGREIDLRLSTMPTLTGESVVLRILDSGQIVHDFGRLGFDGVILETFLGLIENPNGLILVTGPTGSGKSTTLYTALDRLNTPARKTFSIEDPVEYMMPGIAQVQVQPKIGLTFAHALRSILRQDPDVIMVGEIRDLETAQMAIQAALTGHLVLSTLHTNSAADTIARLIDMGVDDFMIASTLKGTLAQRLVRRLCQTCAEPAAPTAALVACVATAGLAPEGEPDWRGLRRPVGCADCRRTGFRGRIAVCEVLPVTPTVADAIVGRGRGAGIAAAAAEARMPSMLADGLSKVLRGATTLDEVLRITQHT